MKKIILLSFLIISFCNGFAQNVGIGTTEPMNKLHINGSLLVNNPPSGTSTAPTATQTKTMVNASTVTFAIADSTGRIYDPGGPSGNYNANLLAYAFIDFDFSSYSGIEITAESMQLGTGDSLIIKEYQNAPTSLLAVGNGYTATGKWIFNYPGLYIIFKSNADANVGSGFSLLFRRLNDNTQLQPEVSGYAGQSLFFDIKTGSLRSGNISSTASRGYFSTGMGVLPTASGYSSTAIGAFTTASGASSTAMGNFTKASGDYSTALGSSTFASAYLSTAIGGGTNASGDYSTAMGYNTQAQGDYSTTVGYKTIASGIKSTAFGDSTRAIGDNATTLGYHTLASGDYATSLGYNTTASGLRSTAIGNNASTNNQINSFAIGGTGGSTVCTSPNQFMTRFDNYTFWISASNYAYLLPSSNGWAYTSDKNKKERFEELNGDEVLKKISKIQFCSWNFKAADTKQYRHYGITAQDFYNAFGSDRYGKIGNDTTVSPLDMMGVAYSAIKALEKRSTNLLQDNKQLKEDNALLQKNIEVIKNGYALANDELKNKLALLEARLNDLAAIKEKNSTEINAVVKKN